MLVLTWGILGACLILTGWAGVRAVRGRGVIVAQLGAVAIILLASIAQMITAGIGLGGGHPADGVLLWGYLITAFLLLPAASWWALLDTSRWSSAILAFAAVTVALLHLRIWQIWVSG